MASELTIRHRATARGIVAGLSLVAALGAREVRAGGEPCGTWAEVAVPEPLPDSILLDVAAVSEDDAWAVGSTGGNTLAMHWNGAAWTIVPTPNPGYSVLSRRLNAVAALASDDVWAAGTAEMNIPPLGYIGEAILIMHWDGASWQLVLPPGWPEGWGSSFIHTIEAVAPDDVWFGGEGPYYSPAAGALALHWDGASFELVPTETFDTNCGGTFGCGHAIADMAALASDDIWAVGHGGDGDASQVSQIWHWDGATWAHTPGPAPGFWHDLNAVTAFAPNDVWALGGVWERPEGVILHWDGAEWTQVAAPVSNFYTVAAIAPDDIWSVGDELVHYDGQTWSVAPGAPPGQTGLGAAASVGPCDVWMVGHAIGNGPYFIDPYAQRLQAAPAAPGDIDGDGAVGIIDFLALLSAWGRCAGCPADIDGDGDVGILDLLMLLANWSA